MKNLIYLKFVFTGAIIFLVVTAFTGQPGNNVPVPHKKIIKFSHGYHLQEVGADCEDCHVNVRTSTALSDTLLPTMDACGSCHDVEDDDECETCHYEDVYEPFPADSIELNFNHKFHLESQKLNCETCHKGLDKVNYGKESSTVFPEMEQCATCHNNESVATNECSSCHISTVNLLPDTHKEVNFLKNHKFAALQEDENCAMCHTNNFCEDCHVSTNRLGVKNTASDFFTPFSPHKFLDNTKQQQITTVHDLNYRFTHGIDAKGKTKECQTCHQIETFCAECHDSKGGDYALGGFTPTSHLQPNFTTIGVGSGGGLHAELAQRDIESCASCHDTQGADPACILCHNDPDGIKGTNPRTHKADFMMDTHGEWHESMGAVCFNCHTDPNARPDGTPGVGFCGYCHGSNPD